MCYFFNNPNDISNAAITFVSVHRKNLGNTPLTTDTTNLNYNAILNDKTSNNCLKSPFIKTQETLNAKRYLTQQDIQTPSHFVNEEIVETLLHYLQKHNKVSHLFIQHLQQHITKIKFLSHQRPCNQQSNHPSL